MHTMSGKFQNVSYFSKTIKVESVHFNWRITMYDFFSPFFRQDWENRDTGKHNSIHVAFSLFNLNLAAETKVCGTVFDDPPFTAVNFSLGLPACAAPSPPCVQITRSESDFFFFGTISQKVCQFQHTG